MVQGHPTGKQQTRIQTAEPRTLGTAQCWLPQSWWPGLHQQVSPRQARAKGSDRGHQLSLPLQVDRGHLHAPKVPKSQPGWPGQETQYPQGSGGEVSFPGMAQRVGALLAPSPSPGPRCPLPSASPASVGACLLERVVTFTHFPTWGSGFGVS